MTKPTPTEIRGNKRTRFNIENPRGQVRKYIVSITDEPDKRPCFFLSTLDPKFLYVGEMNPEDGDLRITGGSKFDEDSDTFKIGRAALAVIFGRRDLPEGFKIRKPEDKKKGG